MEIVAHIEVIWIHHRAMRPAEFLAFLQVRKYIFFLHCMIKKMIFCRVVFNPFHFVHFHYKTTAIFNFNFSNFPMSSCTRKCQAVYLHQNSNLCRNRKCFINLIYHFTAVSLFATMLRKFLLPEIFIAWNFYGHAILYWRIPWIIGDQGVN